MSMCILCQKWGWWCSWPLRGRSESVCYDVNENDADGSRWGVQGDIQAKWRQRQTTSRSPALHWGYHHQHHLITSVCVSECLSVCLSVCLCVWSFHHHHFTIILSPSLSSWLIKSISPTSGKFKDFCKTHLSGLVSTRSRAPLAAETSLLSSLQGTESQRLRSVFSFYLWWLVIKSHPKSLARKICLSWNKILPRLQ